MKTKQQILNEIKKDKVVKGAISHFPESHIAIERAVYLTYYKIKGGKKENG